MKRRNYKYFIRQSHRYLGIFIGIQFLLWTLGGLYFSWTNIAEIRGENLMQEQQSLKADHNFISPQTVFDALKQNREVAEIDRFQLIQILGEPFYEIRYRSAGEKTEIVAAGALDGKIRPLISEEEAQKIAIGALKKAQNVKRVAYLTEDLGKHHEYRERPLPAWAVTFEDDLTVYLSAQTGQIGAFRTNKWRVFDFLWMLHTMDFEGRDNINNYILRGFSILGIITILSGFLLFFVSSKFFGRLFSAKRGAVRRTKS
jgi:uncharacterized iron-regulated membrane protein